MMKQISQLLPALDGYRLICPADPRAAGRMADRRVTALCCDSRKAGDASLFFCLPGAQADGHRYAPAAYRNGTRAFVVERELELPDDALQIIVPDARTALADASACFYEHPDREMTLIGITGTKGKTTTALLTAAVLNAAGRPTGYVGTNGIEFAGMHFPTVNSTPESVEIFRYLRYMLDSGVRTCVMEVSSQGLWKGRVRGLTFGITMFTNLSPDHVGGAEHPDFDHYMACKHTLFTDYGTSLVLCQANDPHTDDMTRGVTAPILCFGVGPSVREAAWSADGIAPAWRDGQPGVSFDCFRRGAPLGTHFLPLPGRFNVENALGALAVCCDGLGIRADEALDSLGSVVVPGRFQTVTSDRLPGVTFVIDYAHNGVSLASILDALREYRPGRLICLFGSVGGRTYGRRKDMAEAAAYRADLCILTSDNPGPEDPMHVIREIDEAFPADGCPRLLIPDREEAIRRAVSLARPGDLILLAGKGHETYQLIGTRMVPFCEQDILRSAFGELSAADRS